MATTGVLLGTNMIIYDGSDAISYSTSCSISVSSGTVDVTNKDTTQWRSKLSNGISDWSASFDGLFAFDGSGVTPAELFDKMRAGTTITMKMSTDTLTDGYWVGDCLCTSISADFPDQEASSFSGELEGVGRLRWIVT